MIEDPEALDQIDAIATVDGIFFIGRGDSRLRQVVGGMPSVKDAVIRIIAAAEADKPGLRDGSRRRRPRISPASAPTST